MYPPENVPCLAASLPGIYADVGVRVIASPTPAQREMDLPPGGGSTS